MNRDAALTGARRSSYRPPGRATPLAPGARAGGDGRRPLSAGQVSAGVPVGESAVSGAATRRGRVTKPLGWITLSSRTSSGRPSSDSLGEQPPAVDHLGARRLRRRSVEVLETHPRYLTSWVGKGAPPARQGNARVPESHDCGESAREWPPGRSEDPHRIADSGHSGPCREIVSAGHPSAAGACSIICSRAWNARATRSAWALASSARSPANSSSTVVRHSHSHRSK